MSSRISLPMVCLSLLLVSVAAAQEAPRGGGFGGARGGGFGRGATLNPDEIATRTYNVADLLRPTGDYPLPSPSGVSPIIFGADGQPMRQPAAARAVPPIDADSLAKLIQNTIAPESWADNGGNIGRISRISTMLVVTQSNATHEAIYRLLNEIRRSAGPTSAVIIRATWVQTDARQILAPTSEVNEEWIGKQKTYCESQITCFNGQVVHHTSGMDKSFVSDLTPIVGTNAVAFDPQIGAAATGVKMQLAPQLVPDTDLVILDVQAEVTEAAIQSPPAQVMSYAITPNTAQVGNSTANIDRVNVLRQQFKTTTRIPVRKKIIIGGMTLEPASAEGAGRQLYLIVEIDTVK